MTAPGKRTRVAILGGGMASLSAAAELVREPGAADRYDITVYQLGWRVGGKGASGRNRAPDMGMRIEEHGLHVWFGCYDDAWRLLQRCYGSLGRGPDMMKLFQGQTDTPYMENVNGWKVWPISFPRKYGTLGDESIEKEVLGYMRVIWDFLYDTAKRFVGHAKAMSPGANTAHESFFRRIFDDTAGAIADLERHARAYEEFLKQIVESDPDAKDPHRGIVIAAEGIRALLLGDPTPIGALDDDIRRDAIMLDLAITALLGMARDLVLFRGFDPLDAEDIRAWFKRHGARDETLTSAPMRGLYDLCFAYPGGTVNWENANFSAGAALVTVLRIVSEYPDYVVYEMRAGMGEVVIAPVYQYLKQQGVKFEFFQQATRLELAPGAGSVAAVHFTQQAKVKGGLEYDPLFKLDCPANGIQSLMCWPSEPKYELLENGDALKGYNLESKWSGWPGVGEKVIRAGDDYDVIVLGISIEEVKSICAEFRGPLPQWGAMFDALVTVETVGVQLWMTRTLDELGWKYGAVPIDAGPEPIDVWADRTDILAREKWTSDPPKSLHYLCGPLDGSWANGLPRDKDFPVKGKAAATALTRSWLESNAGAIWPLTVRDNMFDWSLLRAPGRPAGPERLDAQYIRANIDPTERYVLSLAGGSFKRLKAGGSGLANLLLAGDWTHGEWNAGCIESAVESGIEAAKAVAVLTANVAR
jgi:uncharacterized protein with NAD-binding domain and iron-sulfur cluster